MPQSHGQNDQTLIPDLSEFRFAIEWLMNVGVSSPRLATLFGTSAENIRQLKYSAPRHREPSLIAFVPDLDLVPSTNIHRGVGIRSHREILRRSTKASPTLNWLAEQVDTRFESNQQQYQFLRGAHSLLLLKQKLGHVSEGRRLAMAGVLEQKIAWFFVHSGFTRSAVNHASRSLWLLQAAYYRLGRQDDVREFIKALLILSHANLLAGRPTAALQLLDIGRHAADSIGAQPGSDYYRQRGVAFYQLGSTHDDEAKEMFTRSEQQMSRLGEARNEAQAMMTGSRYVSLLHRPDWENALQVLETVEGTFGSRSIETSITRHWTAACGLLTDDDKLRQQAREIIGEAGTTASQFGHQATISKLLSITPELGLSRGLQALWIRKALYQNTFRFK